MVTYTEEGITVQVRWASKPYIITQSDEQPPIKLIGIRLAGNTVQVALFRPPLDIQWVAPEQNLSPGEAERWARTGFGRLCHR